MQQCYFSFAAKVDKDPPLYFRQLLPALLDVATTRFVKALAPHLHILNGVAEAQ
jgi:hypothetical protein